ncbi:peptidoglycan-binding domain-containing protein [Dorea sp.]
MVQEKLNATGYDCGKVDGIFGGGTEKAVKNLQKAHGLVQDGIVGKRTWRILLGM